MRRTLPAVAAAAALLLSTAAHAAEVRNPSFRQEGNRIVITYDLEADGPAPVVVKGSQDGGRTWDLSMQHVCGDVGEKVVPGKGRRLVWDLLRDYPRGLASSQVVFDLETSGGASFTDPFTGMEFVLVKGGTFEMGDLTGDGRADEKPVHPVTVSDFYLGKYEVTQAQWEKVMGSNPSYFKGADRPVEKVSWNDAQEFLRKLNQQTGRKNRAQWRGEAKGGGNKGFPGPARSAGPTFFEEGQGCSPCRLGRAKRNPTTPGLARRARRRTVGSRASTRPTVLHHRRGVARAWRERP